jgi:ribosome-binding factor A
VRLRITPDLVFFWDDTEKKAQRIEEILSGLEIPPAEEECGEPGK